MKNKKHYHFQHSLHFHLIIGLKMLPYYLGLDFFVVCTTIPQTPTHILPSTTTS